MKVVIPVGALHIGGGCRVLANVANALAEAGHDTEVVIPENEPIKYKLHCFVRKIPVLAREYIPYGDVVLTNFFTTFRPSFEAWPKQCIRLSLGFEPYFVPESIKPEALWTYGQGVPTISISHWLDDQIYQNTRNRGYVVNLGIDPRVFYASPRQPSKNVKTILYIARDPNAGYEVKGFNDFVRSMDILRQSYDLEFKVTMICPEQALHLTEIPYQIFRPRTDDEMAELYRQADVFVSTSWNEGFALPPLEAMACGAPVVTTNSGGILDFCTHQKSALIVPIRDVSSLADNIYHVLRDLKLWKKIREGGIESSKYFTDAEFKRNIVSTIEEISKQL